LYKIKFSFLLFKSPKALLDCVKSSYFLREEVVELFEQGIFCHYFILQACIFLIKESLVYLCEVLVAVFWMLSWGFQYLLLRKIGFAITRARVKRSGHNFKSWCARPLLFVYANFKLMAFLAALCNTIFFVL
jgi:hypothetical protein